MVWLRVHIRSLQAKITPGLSIEGNDDFTQQWLRNRRNNHVSSLKVGIVGCLSLAFDVLLRVGTWSTILRVLRAK